MRRRQNGIREVAQRAGVSTATVSRALSEPNRVARETRERVMEAVEALSYTPHAVARDLRSRRTMTILMIVPRLGNPFCAEMTRAVHLRFAREGYGLIIGDLGYGASDYEERRRRLVDLAWSGRIDGIVSMLGPMPSNDPRKLHEAPVPLIGLSADAGDPRWPTIKVDDAAAVRKAVRVLVEKGHRSLAYVGGEPTNAIQTVREKSFFEAVAAFGVRGQSVQGDFDLKSGEEAGRRFIASGVDATGVLACSDEAALGFIYALRTSDRRVPEDVSVIGFDGIDITQYVYPSVATMVQPFEKMADATVTTMMEMVRSGAQRASSPMPIFDAPYRDGGTVAECRLAVQT